MMLERLVNAYFHHIVRPLTEWRCRQRWKANGGGNSEAISIISQNCAGGIIYHTLKMQFLSPTINLTIVGNDFVRFIENLEYYISVRPVAITDNYIEKETGKSYPRFQVGDVKVNCLHYKTCQEAITAWERRKRRINFGNIFVIAASWDLNEDEALINRVLETKYRTVILTTNRRYKGREKMAYIEGEFELDKNNNPYPSPINFMKNSSYRYFEKSFDYVELLKKA